MTTVAVAQDVTPFFDAKDVQRRIAAAIHEMRLDLFERDQIVHNMWVARVGALHHIQVGPGGIAKTFAVNRMAKHVEGEVFWSTTLDEQTDESKVFGPSDVKAMVEEGRSVYRVEGMLPEATVVMLDETFNANTPMLHALMPVLNERMLPNGRNPLELPLRSAFMGTNWINADVSVAWFWDRVHIRDLVDDIQDRDNLMAMVDAAILRMAAVGRGHATVLPGQQVTTVTLDELDSARQQSLLLPVSDAARQMFYDIRDELMMGSAQVRISPRRMTESLAAVKANAWIRGHDQVEVADLDILSSMWWTVQDQRAEVFKLITSSCNPLEYKALDLLDDLKKVQDEIATAATIDRSDTRRTRLGVEAQKNLANLQVEAQGLLSDARDAGVGTGRIEELLGKLAATQGDLSRAIYGFDPAALAAAARS